MVRAPLVLIGSLVTWTMTSCPSFSRSSMRAPPPARAASSASSSSSVGRAAGLARQQALEVVGRAAHVRDVQVRRLLEADVDERGLHAGQHALDPALVDVAGDPTLALALDVELAQDPSCTSATRVSGPSALITSRLLCGIRTKLGAREKPRAVGAHADANVRVHRETSRVRGPVVTRNCRQFNDIADFRVSRHAPCSSRGLEAADRVSARFALPSSP